MNGMAVERGWRGGGAWKNHRTHLDSAAATAALSCIPCVTINFKIASKRQSTPPWLPVSCSYYTLLTRCCNVAQCSPHACGLLIDCSIRPSSIRLGQVVKRKTHRLISLEEFSSNARELCLQLALLDLNNWPIWRQTDISSVFLRFTKRISCFIASTGRESPCRSKHNQYICYSLWGTGYF